MAGGKEEWLGDSGTERREEKARRDSTGEPLQERSAMAEFQEEMLVLLTHLEKKAERFGFVENALLNE